MRGVSPTKSRWRSDEIRNSVASLSCAAAFAVGAAAFAGDLESGFADPPQSARPHVWWHWLNGNITKQGIEKDLDWLSEIGVGGVQNFNVDLGTPLLVEKRLAFMSPEWKDAFRLAVEKADALDLDFAIAASPGWSETGGPWVEPRDGMKKLTWSSVRVKGAVPFSGRVTSAPTATGPYQDLQIYDALAFDAGDKAPLPEFSAPVAVIAYELQYPALPPADVFVNGAGLADAGALTDDSIASAIAVNRPEGAEVTEIVFAYPEPVSVRSAQLYVDRAYTPFTGEAFAAALWAEEGGAWRKVSDVSLGETPTTSSFTAVTAARFKLTLAANQMNPVGLSDAAPGAESFSIFATPSGETIDLGILRFSAEPAVRAAEAKAGFGALLDYFSAETLREIEGATPQKNVIDLTKKVGADGVLTWTPPSEKDWRIVSFGFSLTGKENHPAPDDAQGLEVDKFDAAAVRRYLEHYFSIYRGAAGDDLFGMRGVNALLTDSIESGASNWTFDLPKEFKKRRGYSLTPWMPALTGAIIGSPEATEGFLYDYRKTLAELLAVNHYGVVAEVAHENGLKVYGEALEDKRPLLGDDMAMRANADIPMAALWTYGRNGGPRSTLLGDMKGAASVAHVYGRTFVSAESMTAAWSPWAFAPSDLKRIIDLEFAYGINKPIIHTSPHSPLEGKEPGLSLAIFGQYFNRHETWSGMARPWIDYIARTGFMLQQGRDVADVAYFYGEEAPITAQFADQSPADLPKRYAYDFVNADIIIDALSVENGELATSGGARYKVLFLGEGARRMTYETLRAIEKLAKNGATIIGEAPVGSAGLSKDGRKFEQLTAKLWASPETSIGNGRIIRSGDVDETLSKLGVVRDFEPADGDGDDDILFVHRKTSAEDIFFVNNRTENAKVFDARFRIAGKKPEIWRAIDGSVEFVSYRLDGDAVVASLRLAPDEAIFVVFREAAEKSSWRAPEHTAQLVAEVSGSWSVTFEPGRGAPEKIALGRLAPLNEIKTPGVRYFSGVATYKTTFTLSDSVDAASQYAVDLGDIGDVAEVFVNGEYAGTTWFSPYRIDVSGKLRSGKNDIEVRVANLWVNRLIGDKQPGAEKITFTAAPTYNADAPLRPSGLIGPVRLIETDKNTGEE